MADITLPPMHPTVEAQVRELLGLVIEGEPLVDVPSGFPEIDEQFRRQHERSKAVLAETGYITHLAQLSYPDGWRFWALAHLGGDLRKHAGNYRAEQVETVFLTRDFPHRLTCRALVVIETGEILHIEPYPKPVMRR